MSPASRSKSKDKRASKEPQKASSKPSAPPSTGSGTPTSGYNPLLGTFHTLETASLSSTSTLNSNGRFRNIDDTDENSGSSPGTGFEYDAISNNDSWSGESEDHKEKASNPTGKQGTIPGADNDKREKTRQKNERKHQRQKERRAQDLHERCSGYLMSRKLEVLAQQLVTMGFSSERATMALILNEGKVEESVAWLFEEGEEADKHKGQNLDGGSNLKIDIAEELAKIADMEIKYNCLRQDVERAIVAGEGDLEKAAETLRAQRHDPPATPKPEATGDPPNINNGRSSVAVTQNLLRAQPKSNSSSTIQTRKEEKDFNYTKTAVGVPACLEAGSKNVPPAKRIQPKLEWAKPQQIATPAEKRWPSAGSNPSVSYSVASSLQVPPPPPKAETRYVAVGSEPKTLQPGSLREPVIVMQRPQSINSKQVLASISSSPGAAAGWYPNNVEVMKSNGLLSSIITARSLSPNNLSANQLYHHHLHQAQLVSSSSPVVPQGAIQGNDSWSRMSTLPTLSAASSLGLFSWLGSNNLAGSSSSVDWSSGGSMNQLDYTNIDWSLDRSSPLSTNSSGLWQGLTFMNNPTPMYDSSTSGMGVKPTMSSALPNGNMISNALLQDGGMASAEASAASSREWTSPFEGKDLFSLPRQFVSSPSL
ncbi:hypothetical protein PVL29_007898 [Vitis rotundifolia]|uniref:UBA domain-containing protein n=1 Tax=Vitis rotundifolia TaxID=103349 RepID=A0AA39A1B1_VITRO|nr:hypothetical protein PVL29_007898 [Vitis rotundifolia]